MLASVQEAKTHLSRLIAAVEAGEEVVIRRGQKPVARLVPIAQEVVGRRFGAARGLYASPPDGVFGPLDEAGLAAWERAP